MVEKAKNTSVLGLRNEVQTEIGAAALPCTNYMKGSALLPVSRHTTNIPYIREFGKVYE